MLPLLSLGAETSRLVSVLLAFQVGAECYAFFEPSIVLLGADTCFNCSKTSAPKALSDGGSNAVTPRSCSDIASSLMLLGELGIVVIPRWSWTRSFWIGISHTSVLQWVDTILSAFKEPASAGSFSTFPSVSFSSDLLVLERRSRSFLYFVNLGLGRIFGFFISALTSFSRSLSICQSINAVRLGGTWHFAGRKQLVTLGPGNFILRRKVLKGLWVLSFHALSESLVMWSSKAAMLSTGRLSIWALHQLVSSQMILINAESLSSQALTSPLSS